MIFFDAALYHRLHSTGAFLIFLDLRLKKNINYVGKIIRNGLINSITTYIISYIIYNYIILIVFILFVSNTS